MCLTVKSSSPENEFGCLQCKLFAVPLFNVAALEIQRRCLYLDSLFEYVFFLYIQQAEGQIAALTLYQMTLRSRMKTQKESSSTFVQ